jgi:hypothetical protein
MGIKTDIISESYYSVEKVKSAMSNSKSWHHGHMFNLN